LFLKAEVGFSETYCGIDPIHEVGVTFHTWLHTDVKLLLPFYELGKKNSNWIQNFGMQLLEAKRARKWPQEPLLRPLQQQWRSKALSKYVPIIFLENALGYLCFEFLPR
jgi:hypothetical protein